MKSLFTLICSFAAFQLHAGSGITWDSLDGAWKCIYSVYDDPNIAADELAPYSLDTPDLIVFSGDSLFQFNYPCYMAGKTKLVLKQDTLDEISAPYDPSKGPPEPISVWDLFPAKIFLNRDTLTFFTGTRGGIYTEKKYVRTTVDSAQIALLKRNGIDVRCISGKWKLETTYDTGYDGNGVLDYQFPFVPQYVIIFREKSRADFSNGTLWLKADGTARPFTITELSSDGLFLDVQTDSWYRSDRPWVLHYHKEQ